CSLRCLALCLPGHGDHAALPCFPTRRSSDLGARLQRYEPEWLDTLAAAGEVRWAGVQPLGQRDGRIALYLADQMSMLLPPRTGEDRKSTRLNSSHVKISYAVFCLKKKNRN